MNFGENPFPDVREISRLPKHDVLLAGFPCQPFSYAGRHNGFGDTRGTLFFELERILSESRPRAFLLENVRGLTSHDGGRTFKTIIHSLKKIGYDVHSFLLNSFYFGVPQNRVRVYILGFLGKKAKLEVKGLYHRPTQATLDSNDLPLTTLPKVRDILEEDPPENYNCSADFVNALGALVGGDFAKMDSVRLIDYRGGKSIHSWDLGFRGKCTKEEIKFMNTFILERRKKRFGKDQDGKLLTFAQIKTFWKYPGLEKLLESLVKKRYLSLIDGKYKPVCGNMSFEVFKFLPLDGASITLTAADAARLGVVFNGRVRHITVREAAQLQGFPDEFKLHKDRVTCYAQLGESVTVPVIRHLCCQILENIM
jgi:DNA (cytosine-5)-methyltransferase 1